MLWLEHGLSLWNSCGNLIAIVAMWRGGTLKRWLGPWEVGCLSPGRMWVYCRKSGLVWPGEQVVINRDILLGFCLFLVELLSIIKETIGEQFCDLGQGRTSQTDP
jgi:hypothetical protein